MTLRTPPPERDPRWAIDLAEDLVEDLAIDRHADPAEDLAVDRDTDPPAASSYPSTLPGAIQPIGALVLLRGPELTVVAGSASLEPLLGLALAGILGCRASDVLPAALFERLPPAVAALAVDPQEVVPLSGRLLGGLTAQVRSGAGGIVLELESADPAQVAALGAPRGEPAEYAAVRWLGRYQRALECARTVPDLGLAASTWLQALTGYDRVTLLLADPEGELRPAAPAVPGTELPWWTRFTARYPLVAAERAQVLRQRGQIYAVADVEAAALPLQWADAEPAEGEAGLWPSVLGKAPEFVRLGLLGADRAALLITLGDGSRPWGCLLCVDSRPRWPSPPLRELCALAGAQLFARLEHLDREPAGEPGAGVPRPLPNQLPRQLPADSLSVLAGGFAHDLNNLLTGVLGSVALVRSALLAEQAAEPYLEQIETAALCAGDLCRQVLAHAGRGSFVTERVHLSQLVAQTLPLLQLALGGRARLKLQLVDDLPLVIADATQLRQVLLNLVTNGAEAIFSARRDGGELTIATRIVQVDAESLRAAYAAPDASPGLHVALQVRDNGVGIEPEVLDRVFEPFFTTKPSGSPTGRGLGLAIVLGVVRGHRGVLQVRSSVGQGTDFELLFPSTLVVEPPAPPAPAAPGTPPRLAASDHTVLVIDDEPTVREFISRVLHTAGYRVIAVSSSKEALAQLGAAGARISLVILDWALSPGDGEAVARQIHRQRALLPLVILSGYGPAEYAKRLHGVPIAGTLQKPFRLEALLNLVRRILTRAAP